MLSAVGKSLNCRNLLGRIRNYSNNYGIIVAEEVRNALETGKPVVALESTIITHGMPHPVNIQCALDVENQVRVQGAIPATIAIINGDIKVGLNRHELSQLGDVNNSKSIKTSRRDLCYVISNRLNGGTTVSGTILIANKVGIPIFATGGIGGVHRQGETTLDISADLLELGRSSVSVISSGIKSILDIPKTLEYLETQGVFVATFGDNNEFPAFYSTKSGSRVPYSVSTPEEAARIIETNRNLKINSGMLFAVPVPEQYALDHEQIENAIEDALKQAGKLGVHGKEITPFLLEKIAKITDGKSLETNMVLVKNNARIAAEIAVKLAELKRTTVGNNTVNKAPVVIGGSNLDCSIKLKEGELKFDGRIHNGKFTLSAGGVARNIYEALTKLNRPPIAFLTALGNDQQGRILKTSIPDQRYIRLMNDQNTAQCTSVFDPNGDCFFLMGDMQIHQSISPDVIESHCKLIEKSPLIVLDGNLSIPTIDTVLRRAKTSNIPVFYEPTDVEISVKPFETPNWNAVKFISPNFNELKYIAKHLKISNNHSYNNKIDEAANIARKLAEFIDIVLVTLSSDGLLIARKGEATDRFLSNTTDNIQVRYYQTEKLTNFVNASGAGDCLASGIIAGFLEGLSEERCVSVGFEAAKTALFSTSAVADVLFNKNHKCWNYKASYRTIN